MECFEAKFNAFQIFWVEIRYFSNVLDPRHIVFNVFVYKYEFFEVFVYKVRLNSFECFETKEDIFQIFGVEFPYISNYFGTKSDTFHIVWVYKSDPFRMLFTKIDISKCFAQNRVFWGQNQILFQCFE